MTDTYVLCSCGGVVDFEGYARLAVTGTCRDCRQAWRGKEYEATSTCVDCGALYRPDDPDDGCPCGGEG